MAESLEVKALELMGRIARGSERGRELMLRIVDPTHQIKRALARGDVETAVRFYFRAAREYAAIGELGMGIVCEEEKRALENAESVRLRRSPQYQYAVLPEDESKYN
ncbi:MAG: hypothetical protein V2A62_00190 [Candidatus Woesearchaeota archaeon]